VINLLWKSAWVMIPMFCMVAAAKAQSSYDLRSPDKRIEVRIRTAHGVRYDVVLNGRAILQDSSLSMDVDHKTYGRNVKVVAAKDGHHDEVLEPVVRQKFAKIATNCA
jgi:Glycosyl-hydrolase 97 N-terminal